MQLLCCCQGFSRVSYGPQAKPSCASCYTTSTSNHSSRKLHKTMAVCVAAQDDGLPFHVVAALAAAPRCHSVTHVQQQLQHGHRRRAAGGVEASMSSCGSFDDVQSKLPCRHPARPRTRRMSCAGMSKVQPCLHGTFTLQVCMAS